MNHGCQGVSGASGAMPEKRATSTTSPASRERLRTTSSDHTSGSSGVAAQPATRSARTTLDRISGVAVVERAIDLGGEARQRTEQRISPQAVEHALAMALAGDQTRALEHREMARHRGPAHTEALREVGGGQRRLGEERDDLTPRQRAQRVEHPLGIVNQHANSM